MMTIVIRPPKNDDFTAIAEITNHYIATSAIHFGYRPYKPSELRAVYNLRDRHPWYVYEEEGRVLAYAKAGVWRERDAYQWTCEVGLYVADHARGRGIGRQLYDALLTECAKYYRSAVAGITVPNPASVKLHEACGFERVGTFVDAGYKNNAWHAVEFWQKRFKTGPGGP